MPHNLREPIYADDMYCPSCGNHARDGSRYCSGEHEHQLKHPRTKRMTYLDATRKRLAELQRMEKDGTIRDHERESLVHEQQQLDYLLEDEHISYRFPVGANG